MVRRIELFAPFWLAFSPGVVALIWRGDFPLRRVPSLLAWRPFLAIGGRVLGISHLLVLEKER